MLLRSITPSKDDVVFLCSTRYRPRATTPRIISLSEVFQLVSFSVRYPRALPGLSSFIAIIQFRPIGLRDCIKRIESVLSARKRQSWRKCWTNWSFIASLLVVQTRISKFWLVIKFSFRDSSVIPCHDANSSVFRAIFGLKSARYDECFENIDIEETYYLFVSRRQ